jgi:hypothetical protein
MGMGLTILSGQIDMSIGGVMTASAVISAMYFAHIQNPTALDILVTFLIGIGVGSVFGFLNGILIARYKFNFWLVTFAMMSISYGIAQVVTGGKVISGFSKSFRNVTRFSLVGIPMVVYIAVIVSLLMFFLTYKTNSDAHVRGGSFGKMRDAVGDQGGKDKVSDLLVVRSPFRVRRCTFGIEDQFRQRQCRERTRVYRDGQCYHRWDFLRWGKRRPARGFRRIDHSDGYFKWIAAHGIVELLAAGVHGDIHSPDNHN